MVRVPPCVQLSGTLQCLEHPNDNWIQGAAWDFEMLLRFERVESRRAAQIVTIGVARCVWWCRCDALVCARSVSVDSAAMETIGVISMAAVLALGPGAEIEIVDL